MRAPNARNKCTPIKSASRIKWKIGRMRLADTRFGTRPMYEGAARVAIDYFNIVALACYRVVLLGLSWEQGNNCIMGEPTPCAARHVQCIANGCSAIYMRRCRMTRNDVWDDAWRLDVVDEE